MVKFSVPTPQEDGEKVRAAIEPWYTTTSHFEMVKIPDGSGKRVDKIARSLAQTYFDR